MKITSLDFLACPTCHKMLELNCPGTDREKCLSGTLICNSCPNKYPIINGIPHFIKERQLTGFNRRFSHMYDWFSWGYRAFSKLAFAFIGMKEETGRREILDRLDPRGGKVLEVSIGPGVNLPYLIHRPDVGEVIGLDISLGQLNRCQSYLRKQNREVDLFLGNAEQLPFADNFFQGVFHIGGINFFNDKQAAIDEMIRVARPGTRILIGDETEKGAKGYEKVIPGFKSSFNGSRAAVLPPIDLIPKQMIETQLFNVWKSWFYCIEFRKP